MDEHHKYHHEAHERNESSREESGIDIWNEAQVTVDESIDVRHVLMIDSSQNNYEENHHKRRKAPAQKAKEQVSPLSVLITHHQHVPEVHRLGKEAI